MKATMFKLALVGAGAVALSACGTLGGADEAFGSRYYSLVRVHRVQVGDGTLSVTPPRPWNRSRPDLFEDIRDVEDWTLNGPYLDGITFVTSLKSGRYLIRQSRRASQQVPKFRSDMTPPEIAAMLESLYRVKGGAVDFRTLSLQPRPFLDRRLGAPEALAVRRDGCRRRLGARGRRRGDVDVRPVHRLLRRRFDGLTGPRGLRRSFDRVLRSGRFGRSVGEGRQLLHHALLFRITIGGGGGCRGLPNTPSLL
jgi:hypothetical protein